MLGNSKDIQTMPIASNYDLSKWLRENDVTVLDIKYAITNSSSDRYLVIYTEKEEG